MKPAIIGYPFYGTDKDDDAPPRETLYLVPTCKRCGHDICPCCETWCDTCLNEEDPRHNPICVDTQECDPDGEVEEVGPLYGMDEPKWRDGRWKDE